MPADGARGDAAAARGDAAAARGDAAAARGDADAARGDADGGVAEAEAGAGDTGSATTGIDPSGRGRSRSADEVVVGGTAAEGDADAAAPIMVKPHREKDPNTVTTFSVVTFLLFLGFSFFSLARLCAF